MADEVRREVEVDTALAELYGQRQKVSLGLEANKLSMAYAVGIKPVYATRTRREVRESASEIAATLAGMLADGKIAGYEESRCRELLAKREALLSESARIAAEMEPLNTEYEAKRWSRFFLVTSSAGGHIHRSMSCSTTRIHTGYAWLPDLSGLTEADAVAAHGPLLCTVCYPSAPVEWTLGIPKDETDKCPGSGEYVPKESYNRRYAPCTVCGETVAVTKGYKFRAHKKAEAKS